MKNFLLMIILFSCACNTVKKITEKEVSHTSMHIDAKKDSVSVSEDITKLQQAYFKDNHKSLSISFLPKTGTAAAKPVVIKDSCGSLVIDMGDNIPAALDYKSNNTSKTFKDSIHVHRDSVADKSKAVVDQTNDHKQVNKQKESSRWPLSLIIFLGVLALAAAYTFYRAFK